MENKKNIGVGLAILILILLGGIVSYFKITYSYFGDNITGQLSGLFSVTYASNYPSKLNKSDEILSNSQKGNTLYFVKDVMFSISNEYKFIGWNTEKDGSGISYKKDDKFIITSNIKLYAIWESTSFYGDINLDGKVDITDSELLNNYINENTSLEGVLLINADVNLDGKIDLIDVDIIKQASIGTKGYEGLLSNNSVNIFEIYKEPENNDNGGTSDSDGNTKPSNKPSNKPANKPSNNGGNSQNNNTTNDGNSSGDKEENKQDDVSNNNVSSEDINGGNLNDTDKLVNNDKRKSYAWILVVGIIIISLRFVVIIIKKIIKTKKDDNKNNKL